MPEKLKWFNPDRDETYSWKIKTTTLTDLSQAVITSLLGSLHYVILLLDKPRTLCSGKISGKFTCMQVPSNWDNIRGMQLHLGHLYVSAGTSLFRLKIKRSPLFRKLSDPQLVMNLPDTPSEIAIDAFNGKRMVFYSKESEGRIGQILKYSDKHKVEHMDPLNISCNHFTFTIDAIGHVMYVLTDDWTLSVIRDIHADTPPTRSTVMKVPRFSDLPITKLLFSVDTIYLAWPLKNDVMLLDVQKKCCRTRMLSSKQISRPPRVITVIGR
ncbi:uncharacterized protein [Haliotis asinina]|uniref:uncharacterized protein n=1 Tax=Haliotis asinina TaxID=109174 RepID=UPI0035322224